MSTHQVWSKRLLSLLTVFLVLSANIPQTAMAASREGLFTLPGYQETVFQNSVIQDGTIVGSTLNKEDVVQTAEDSHQGEVVVKFKEDKVDVSRFSGRLTVRNFASTNNLEFNTFWQELQGLYHIANGATLTAVAVIPTPATTE